MEIRRVICLLFLATVCRADSALDAFKQGNAAYAATKFADAVTQYEAAQKDGLHHWIVDYNLGNAYYKAGQLGKAIVHYERAFRRQSGDGDVVYNLGLASSKAGDPRLPGSALLALFWRLFYGLSLNALTLLTSLTMLTVCAGGALLLLGRGHAHADKFGVAVVILLALGLWLGLRIDFAEQSLAIVTTGVAEVRSGPNLSYPANFTVPEGHRVLLLDEQEPVSGWLEIGVPSQGLKGWVPDSAIEKI